MPYLIDGHNVIAALPDIDLEENHDEAKLVLKLRAWTARIRRRATVVFDGGLPGGQSRSLSSPDVEVIFAARRRTNADRIIRERVRSLPDAPNWTVISSDYEILDEAREAGARTLTAQDFAYALNNPPKEEKEKPESVSPAEVERWLEVFDEPEDSTPASDASGSDAARASAQPGSESETPSNKPPRRKRHPRRAQPRRPRPRATRSTRTIAEQLGADDEPSRPSAEPPQRSPEAPAGKPERVSEREVEEWLEVFGEPEESHVPPPKPIKRRRKKPVEPVVDKEGELSEGEVNAWLEVFGNEGSESESESEPSTVAKRPRVVQHRRMTDRLAKHKENVAKTAEEEEDSVLSEDDKDLWYSLFGEES